ncbi:MAG: hypothetical protein KR126chlam1_01201 [Chlamydiae bacterium]|nr:hypothetical protein [Chlamydiota bacterium]
MFFGRKSELQQLQIFFERNRPGIAVCCGRRRIGKSTLIQHATKNHHFVEFYGLSPRKGAGTQAQLNHFSRLLAKNFNIPKVKFDDWQSALDMLAGLTREGEYVIFLDEISWMAGKDRDFPGKLKGVWDTQFKQNPALKLILCGSVSSWIQENILQNKGFVGRVSLIIQLDELPLPDANRFWINHSLISAYEKFKILCVTGGVPRYLEEINPKWDAEENIKQLCFIPGGVLLEEFDKIFSDLFGKQTEKYQDIIRVLLNSPKSTEEICDLLNIKASGGFSQKLNVLTECGFLKRDYVWLGKKRSRLSKYRLCDNYLRFYLKYIEPKKDLIEKGLYRDVDLANLADWSSMMGLQFENLVLNNLPLLLKKLKIAPESLLSASPYFQKRTKRKDGCQIDLLIQTRFTYYVCEVKFGKKIGKDVIEDVLRKIDCITVPKTVLVRSVLIYQGELSNEVVDANFFSNAIAFEEFLTS